MTIDIRQLDVERIIATESLLDLLTWNCSKKEGKLTMLYYEDRKGYSVQCVGAADVTNINTTNKTEQQELQKLILVKI